MSRLNLGNLFNENEDGAPVVSGISTFSSPNYFVPPSGSTAQRPSSPGEGMIRFNTDSGHLEYYSGELWVDVIVKETATNSGRAFFAGGYVESGTPNTNAIEYVTIQSTGNSVDFGDLTRGVANGPAACSSSTRGIFAGGSASDVESNVIEYVTISTTGNSQDFGDLAFAAQSAAATASSSTRGVFAGGINPSILSNGPTDYVEFATLGNAIDFGDITSRGYCYGTSNSIRGIIAGGITPSVVNTIEYITIATTGDATDYGDLTEIRAQGTAASDSHGGLG